MTYNDVRKNENKGFSLVELIVVVAIMAVLVAVLAPSLLAYVERSRAQKDDSAMGEVTNAIMLALADQNVYDEVLVYTCKNNYSCYKDGVNNGAKVETKGDGDSTVEDGEQWLWNDAARLADETEYVFDGNMRGVTITFRPDAVNGTKKSVFSLASGEVNTGKAVADDYINGKVPAKLTFGTMQADENAESYLYNRVRATVGDKIELTSQTYRNSDYTVFIRMGTTGGAEVAKQDAIKVYGQWNGTNLTSETFIAHTCADGTTADGKCDVCGDAIS